LPNANKFRPDLNGLRAVAVTAVLLFHFNISPFSGGFVGVDVFFVLSGFLMTQIITSGFGNGNFSFIRFYLNRIARIVPALGAVVSSALAFGYFVLLPEPYRQLALESVEALTFTVNFHYASDTGYFAPNAAQSWLLHCWSLAVEFQFYILFPVYLWLAKRIHPKRGVIAALVVAMIASLTCSVIQTNLQPTSAFYLLPSRIWEFGFGGLILFFRTPSEKYRNSICIAGLTAVIAAALIFDGQLKYPAFWATIPVVGAGAVVYARAPLNVLRSRFFQFIGKISYSLYLWHWPVLAAGHYLGYGGEGRPYELTMLFVVTLLVSWASFVFIEAPFRDIFRRFSLRGVLILAGGASVCVAVSTAAIATDGLPKRIPDRLLDIVSRAAYRQEYRDGVCFLGPDQKFSELDVKCLEPDSSSKKPTMAIWGDSHAAHLYPGISRQLWAKKYNIVQLTASACSPLPIEKNSERIYCPDIQKQAHEFFRRTKPEVLILSASWRGYISQNSIHSKPGALGFEDLIKLLKSLREEGVGKIIVVGPIIDWLRPLPQVFYRDNFRHGDTLSGSSISTDVDQLAPIDSQYRTAVIQAGAEYVSLVGALCAGSRCMTLIPGWRAEALFQFDQNHLTVDGSEWVASHVIGPALGEAEIPEPFVHVNELLKFNEGSAGLKYLSAGWMPAEGWGTWTASAHRPGMLHLPVDPERLPSAVRIKFWGQLGPTLAEERFVVKFDGGRSIDTKVTLENPIVEQVFWLDKGSHNQMKEHGYLRIEFYAPEGKSPKEMRLNDDRRVLGFGIRELTLQP
jgi:peptidoglycan/LPS O-acetylase OafA/YrhL